MVDVIVPTIGRIVWFWGRGVRPEDNQQPKAAIVTFVHDDRHVSLAVFDEIGTVHGRANVTLRQPSDLRPEYDAFCEWMPYQIMRAGEREAEAK